MNDFRKLLRRYKYVVNLLVLVSGIVLLFIANLIKLGGIAENTSNIGATYDIVIGIGCSITATAVITLFLLVLLPEDTDKEQAEITEDWGMCAIYDERTATAFSNDGLPHHHLDYIAFGLKHFRDANEGPNSSLVKRLRKGLKIRIITLYPKSQYVAERQYVEKRDGISDEIDELWKWKEKMMTYAKKNSERGCAGSIDIKFYNSLPLDFYCRADNKLFVGPYMPEGISGMNITYEFKATDTKGGKYYTQLFEKIWDGNLLNLVDYNAPYLRGNQKVAVENTLKFFCKQLASSEDSKEPIGIVVMFKGNNRRTFFSCNKIRLERNHSYQKDVGTVGRLIALNKDHNAPVKILFEDFENKLAFVSQYTDTVESQKRIHFEERETGVYDDNNVKAILAISVSVDYDLFGAITFDFVDFPKSYRNEVVKMQRIKENENIVVENGWELQRWFKLAESCRGIVQPMLGNEMELQYQKLFEEEWRT